MAVAVLVRWASPTGEVTLRAASLVQHPFLQGMVVMLGVRGVNDPEHPDVDVHSLTLRQADLRYVVEGREAAATEPQVQPAVAAAAAATPPAEALPPARRRAQP
jgi:hypothetical protein